MKDTDCEYSLVTSTQPDIEEEGVCLLTGNRYTQPWIRNPSLLKPFLLIFITSCFVTLYSMWEKIPDDVGLNFRISLVTAINYTDDSTEDTGVTTTSSDFLPDDKNLITSTKSPADLKTLLESEDVAKLLKGPLVESLYEAGFEVPNNETCPEFGASLKILILVCTARENAKIRSDIRQTWGSYAQRNDIAMAFLMGQPKNPTETADIVAECELYSDIIVNNNVDSYSNLTLKITSMLEWVSKYCSEVKFVVKIDDDGFLNVPKVLDIVTSNKDKRRAVFGKLWPNNPVVRDKDAKYFISTELYPLPTLPDYVLGGGYILTGDLIKDMYVRALNTPMFPIEDVFITGFLLQSVNGTRIPFEAAGREEEGCNLKKDVWIGTSNSHEAFDLWMRFCLDRGDCL